jgi:hypothetical protein
VLLAAVLAAGCGRGPAAPADTGSREAVQTYYEALLRQDWAGAHASLHPDSRAQCGAADFVRRARTYRGGLGFEPETVQVRSCEEHGDEAVAHVMLTGRGGDRQRHYQDGVTLRRSAPGWGVVLPPRFGQGR